MTRTELIERVFDVRKRLEAEEKEFRLAKSELGPEPFIFGRRDWFARLDKLVSEFRLRPVVQEYHKLVAECPHEFDAWSDTHTGPFQSRHCRVCQTEEGRTVSYGL